jgi:dihydrofolate synthase/folylpolyglutamate synthase
MQYKEFLEHIYKKYSGNVKLELSRMTGLMADLGNPQDSLCGFHVAGTNGKGSVCASLEALSLAHGHSTALNTSPHLINYTERFRINGAELPFETILAAFNAHEALFEKWDASFFEITTAIAFALFAEANTDTTVMEVGLGGRLDATNLFTPDVSVITNIGLDHVKTLGGTLEIIAAEKAGIIKPGIPLVLGDVEDSPREVIESIAVQKNAPVYRYKRDWFAEASSNQVNGLYFNYRFGKYEFDNLYANLIGEHQAVNIGTAITAFLLYANSKGFEPSEDAIRKAVASINWQGRMQVLCHKPVIIIDGAHNVHGVKALVNTLNKVFPDQKLRLIISILADKDYSEMIHLFCSVASTIYIAQNQSERAASVEAQVAAVAKYNANYKTATSVAEALSMALADSSDTDVIIGGGSLYTVGEILQAYKANA